MMQSSETFSRCFINQASASYPEGVLAWLRKVTLVQRCIKCTMTFCFDASCEFGGARTPERQRYTEDRKLNPDRVDLIAALISALKNIGILVTSRQHLPIQILPQILSEPLHLLKQEQSHQGRPRDTVLTNKKNPFSTFS